MKKTNENQSHIVLANNIKVLAGFIYFWVSFYSIFKNKTSVLFFLTALHAGSGRTHRTQAKTEKNLFTSRVLELMTRE